MQTVTTNHRTTNIPDATTLWLFLSKKGRKKGSYGNSAEATVRPTGQGELWRLPCCGRNIRDASSGGPHPSCSRAQREIPDVREMKDER